MPVSKPCGRYFAMFSRMRLCSPTRSSAGEALSKVGQHATGVAVGFHHEPSDDLDLLRIPRAVDHYHILRYVTHASYGGVARPSPSLWPLERLRVGVQRGGCRRAWDECGRIPARS